MDDKKATPDDYITGLKNALEFHQAQVNKYNLAIHAFEEGYKEGGAVREEPQRARAMNNAEYLRNLSDEQLAEWINEHDDWWCFCNGECPYNDGSKECIECKHSCLDGRLKWLRQEHKE
jgi:hypothetical protein